MGAKLLRITHGFTLGVLIGAALSAPFYFVDPVVSNCISTRNYEDIVKHNNSQ